MTSPCDPETNPEPREEEQEIVLRLGDILPRVPAHLLKPGPHDATLQVRFSVEELAEKISRGRVSVPLDRLASVCPQVFRDRSAFPGEQEIALPLQKLLEQVGMVAPKPSAADATPGGQLAADARIHARGIIEANTAPAPVAVPSPATAPPVASTPSAPPSAQLPRAPKAISRARQILGFFGLKDDSATQSPGKEEHAKVNRPATEQRSPPPLSAETPETPPPVQTSPIAQSPPEPATQPVPADCISLRALPIFRLLPMAVLRPGTLPSEDARVALPLPAIESQLADGHVEIPLEDFLKALPDDLRQMLNSVPKAQVWIPLDEIFQNLPPNHIFYMPPLDPLAEPPAAAPIEEPPSAEAVPEQKDPTPAVSEPEKPAEAVQEPADKTEPPPIEPTSPAIPPTQEPPPVTESSPQPTPAAQEAVLAPVAVPAAVAEPAPAESVTVPETAPPAPEASPETAPPPRAPWMRGFQVPPPRLFFGAAAPAQAASEPALVEPPPPAPATPEAKRTVDFLASQTGIFAAAAFVEGAVFASTDFPRRPDLDALRDFMGAFIHGALESGRRLGWNRVLTIACEQFHLTAVVRDSHFIVALHHDRVLPSPTDEALIAAADDLSKAAG